MPLPDLDALFEYFPDEPEVSAISRLIIEDEDQVQRGEVDDLEFDLVMNVFDLCHRYFPSVPWQLPRRQQAEIAASHERQARYRPPSERGEKDPLSVTVCRKRLRQLDLFCQWLHLTEIWLEKTRRFFGTRPEDFVSALRQAFDS